MRDDWEEFMENEAETFSIKDDKTANWAVKKIREEEEERDRLLKIADDEIEALMMKKAKIIESTANRVRFLRGHVQMYFATVPHKETKTQETYKLLDGQLVMKKASKSIEHDDDKLLAWLKQNGRHEFIKVTEKPAWAEFKKELEITEDGIVDEITGEIPDGLTVVEKPESFEIKF